MDAICLLFAVPIPMSEAMHFGVFSDLFTAMDP